ncbi:MAG TPA: TIGR02757 family protein [Vicinamibacteria bacterium]
MKFILASPSTLPDAAMVQHCAMAAADLKRRLDDLYRHYDHRFVDPDPLQFVRAQAAPADREVVGLLASALAFGNVKAIKSSIGRVLAGLGSTAPADALKALDPKDLARRLADFKHRWISGRDVACLLHFAGQMLREQGSIEAFFALGYRADAPDVGDALASFSARALRLDHGGLYRGRGVPAGAGVRFLLPSPEQGSACKRMNLYLRWMVRRDSVDLGLWSAVPASALVIPVDVHIYNVARRARLTRYKTPGWAMARDLTARLRRFDPDDPVKYDFAFHRMGLFGRDDEIRSLRRHE